MHIISTFVHTKTPSLLWIATNGVVPQKRLRNRAHMIHLVQHDKDPSLLKEQACKCRAYSAIHRQWWRLQSSQKSPGGLEQHTFVQWSKPMLRIGIYSVFKLKIKVWDEQIGKSKVQVDKNVFKVGEEIFNNLCKYVLLEKDMIHMKSIHNITIIHKK